MTSPRYRLTAVLLIAASLLLAGCLLIAGRFQTLLLEFETEEAVAEGESLEVHSTVYSKAVRLRKHFVRVEGLLAPPAGAEMPSSIDVSAIAEDLETGKLAFRFKLTAKPDDAGRFSVTKRYRKDIDAGTLQRVSVTPRNAGIPASTKVTVCVDVAKSKADLPSRSCGEAEMPQGEGELFIVRVVDNEFNPKRVRLEPGDTVRWVFEGSDPTHTTTEMDMAWDSGFIFTRNGDTFEWTPTEANRDQSFPYSCLTHRGCCQMTGAILVGRDAPDPGDDY